VDNRWGRMRKLGGPGATGLAETTYERNRYQSQNCS
jgi:hypothetical protein